MILYIMNGGSQKSLYRVYRAQKRDRVVGAGASDSVPNVQLRCICFPYMFILNNRNLFLQKDDRSGPGRTMFCLSIVFGTMFHV